MRTLMLVLSVAVVLGLLAGCGGGGSSPVNPGGTGDLRGQLTGVANPASFQILVDGSPTSVTPASDGRFTIPRVPAGSHTISLVGGGGMLGAHRNCDVVAGDTTDIGVITPVVGGQIVGLVMRKATDGSLSPLPGVEVLADANPPVYIMGQQNSGGTDPSDPGDPGVILPPPGDGDGITLRAITDANGSYVIPAVPEGAYVVSVNVPGLMQGVNWVWVTAGTTAVADFQLEEAIDPGVGTVQGTIMGVTVPGAVPVNGTNGGKREPLEGALVTIYADQPWMPPVDGRPRPLPNPVPTAAGLQLLQATGFMPPIYEFREFSTLTDAAGHYSLNVPSGYLTISVYKDGYDGVVERFALRPRQVVTKDYTLNSWPPAPEPGPIVQ